MSFQMGKGLPNRVPKIWFCPLGSVQTKVARCLVKIRLSVGCENFKWHILSQYDFTDQIR